MEKFITKHETLDIGKLQRTGAYKAAILKHLFDVLSCVCKIRTAKLNNRIYLSNEYSEKYRRMVEARDKYREYAVRCASMADRYTLLLHAIKCGE